MLDHTLPSFLSTQLSQLQMIPFSLPFKTPIVVKGVTLRERKGYFLHILDQRGKSGFGEYAPLPGFHHEILPSPQKELLHFTQQWSGFLTAKTLLTEEFELTQKFFGLFRDCHLPLTACGQWALEEALFHLWQSSSSPPPSSTVKTLRTASLILSGDSIDPSGTLKIKISGGEKNFTEHLQNIMALANQKNHLSLRIDANQTLKPMQLFALWERLKTLQQLAPHIEVDFIEDPLLPEYFSFYFDPCAPCFPLALDESLSALWKDKMRRIPPQTKALVLKPGQGGGLSDMMAIMTWGQRKNLRLILSSAYNSTLTFLTFQFLAKLFDLQSEVHGLGTIHTTPLSEHQQVVSAKNIDRPLAESDPQDSQKIIFSSDPYPLGPPINPYLKNESFNLETHLQKFASHVALSAPEENFQLSFSQLGVKIQQVQQFLIDNKSIFSGGQKRFALFFPHQNWQFLPLMLGLWTQKHIVIPLPVKLPLDAYPQTLLSLGVDFLIVHNQDLQNEILPLQRVFQLSQFFSTSSKNLSPLPALQLSLEAAIIQTSGSSGEAKGVIHSIGNFFISAFESIRFYQMFPGQIYPLTLPLNHVGGLMILLRNFLCGGQSVLGPNPLQIQTPHFLSLVPTQLQRLLENKDNLVPLKGLHAILLGGAPLPTVLFEYCQKEKIPLSPTYGSTETCSQVIALTPQEFLNLPPSDILTASCGRPLPHAQIEISSQGTIAITSPSLFLGYIINGKKQLLSPSQSWRSKDTARIDSRGYWIVTGRLDQIFISGGENISPQEIEMLLKKHPQVLEAIVVPIPHKEFGEVGAALIQCKQQNAMSDCDFSLWLQRSLPPYKIPKFFLSLPHHLLDGIKYSRSMLQKYVLEFMDKNSDV